jgi:hypothetical protein
MSDAAFEAASPDGSLLATWAPTADGGIVTMTTKEDGAVLYTVDDFSDGQMLTATVTDIAFDPMRFHLWINQEGGEKIVFDLESKKVVSSEAEAGE